MVCLYSLFVSRMTQKVEDDLHEYLARARAWLNLFVSNLSFYKLV